ncbi:MAG TPA: BON domain-containing protein [Gemmatimonadaceae bacterium]|nr:BON domain-containing protein [Gemmatimonadaceae bacterium]
MTFTTRARSILIAVSLTLVVAACGPKDADIKTEATQALAATPGAAVDVAGGVATISGQVADSASRTAAETAVKGVKGVKSVVNNVTVTPPPPVVISADDSLKTNVAAALKDFSTLTADVKDGVVTLTGEIQRASLPKVMQALSALHPKKIENKATVKK